MPRFSIFLVALFFVILFTVLIENALEYRITTSDGVESSLWTILANSLWRKSRKTLMTTTLTKVNFTNSSTSRKRKFYTIANFPTTTTTTSKLKNSNRKIDVESKCEIINKTENFTRFSIGELKIHHPEFLIFEYLDVYRYGLVEFGRKNSTYFPQLKIVPFNLRYRYPFYFKDLDGGEIICCAKDCSNAESYVNNFCPRLKFRATWSCSIKWEFELRIAPYTSFISDKAYQNVTFELTIVRNSNFSFAAFDYIRMKPKKDLIDEVNKMFRWVNNSTVFSNLNQMYKEFVDKFQVVITLSDPSQNYSYELPFNFSWPGNGLFDKTNCNVRVIWIFPFLNTC